MDVYALIHRDLDVRNRLGQERFGGPLVVGGTTCDGSRPTLVEAYEEALDLAIYLRKECAERGLLP